MHVFDTTTCTCMCNFFFMYVAGGIGWNGEFSEILRKVCGESCFCLCARRKDVYIHAR